MTTPDFQNIHYRRVYSTSDEEDGEEGDVSAELPPAVVTTKGTEKNGQWNHIENLDDFFIRIYKYHRERGFACLLLTSVFELVQYVFIVLFATFLMVCVKYDKLFKDPNPTFAKVIDWDKVHNIPSSLVMCLVVALFFWILRLARVVHQGFKGWQMRGFYYNVLHIADHQLQDMQWCDVQKKLMEVQQIHQISIHSKELSELDIHHRILRQKNYFIALQNKDILPFIFNFPIFGKRTFLTEGLKYNLNFLLFKGPGAPFGNQWKLKSDYKDYSRRVVLGKALARRIFLLGLLNFLLCPFILIYQVLYSFFTYAEMIKRSPDTFGARRWSQYGRLYLRHFNELEHEFNSRLCKAYQPASQYMNSFSSPIVVILAKNVAFFAGAILAVLIVLSIYDADIFEAEHILLIMTVLAGIVKVCTGVIPNENVTFCPHGLMKQILSHTHYIPDEWKGRAHQAEVREEFSNFFQYKFVHLIEELMSPLLTPLILCFPIRWKAQQIIDFYRNFTVELIGVGDVCSFAQMDVRRHGNKQWFTSAAALPTEENSSEEQQAEHGKTELSLLHFSIKNPTWCPTDSRKQFIATIKEHAIQESISISQPNTLGAAQTSLTASILKTSNTKEQLDKKMSLQALAQVPVDVDLKIQEEIDQKLQETILNSSMLYMHDLHDQSRRRDSSSVSTQDTAPENLLALSAAAEEGPKMCRSLPTLDEPLDATELRNFAYSSETGQGGSWQENT